MNERKFWKCISILLRNYHAVNKKIFACLIEGVHTVTDIAGIAESSAESLSERSGKDAVSTEEQLKDHLANYTDNKGIAGYLIHYKLLTKKLQHNVEAVGVVDFRSTSYTCKFPCKSFDDFTVRWQDNDVCVEIVSNRANVELSARWADFVLKPKLVKWCENAATDVEKCVNGEQRQVQSLQLVDNEYYNNLYKDLKKKYANKVLKFWDDAKESTDPLKFIYEDLAIAAYLITLWRRTEDGSSAPTAFADLGCGNGLLVYILNEEGYQGYGYDVRARKIWSLYPAATQLLEQTIAPNTFKLPSDVDWLIGNHSDELTPWLPVLAATANYRMRYFLLPCCGYEFSGAKFQRRNSNVSSYNDLMAYVRAISHECGFQTLEDRLKIPSTKRLALVGMARTYGQSEYESKRRSVWNFVAEERSKHPVAQQENDGELKLREKVEAVRNFTQIDKNIIAALVQKIFQLLLLCERQQDEASSWKTGGCLRMCEIVEKLSKTDLQNIRSECGGVKTLLRNNREVFQFCGGDLIGIRRPQVTTASDRRPQTVKKRLCFFKQHHPDGCPLTDEECTFLH